MSGENSQDHPLFRDYLIDIPPGDLPALRHLLSCPLCQLLARVVLVEIAEIPGLPLAGSHSCRRKRRRRPCRRG
jgi:hypothetical protein